LPALLHPQVPQQVPGHYLYNYILSLMTAVMGRNGFWYTMFAVIQLFLQSLYLRNIVTRHKLFARTSYVTSYVFLLLTSIYPQFSSFGETLIINWLLAGAMDVMFSFTQTTQPRKLIYNAGFLLSLAAMFQFTALTFFLLLLVGMLLFRPFNMGEWSVAMVGYITPLYFLLSLLFLADKMYLFWLWPRGGFSLTTHIASPGYLIGTLSGLLLLTGTGVYAMRQNVPLTNIYVRRDWIAVTYYLILSGFVAIFTDGAIITGWTVVMPALSIIISHALLLEKSKRFSNFIFYFSLAFLLYCIGVNKLV
jgi:hypothetical protein